MSTAKNVLEMFLTLNAEAFKKGLSVAGTSVRTMAGGASAAFSQTKARLQENLTAVKSYNAELNTQNGILQTLKGNVAGLAGAYLGFQSIAGIVGMMKEADSAAFTLESSLRAANREFGNVGDAGEWGNVIDRLSTKLRIYSKSELKTAAAATVDMTKRLGLSKEQMEEVIERTADLSAGKTDLQGGIERVTSALRGEAEASEYLGLTLNETYVKAWHEAHNASGIAWKDLTDLEKAQVRYNVFLEQAGPLAGKAADSVKIMAGAYALAKKEISDAVSENESATEAMKSMAEVIAENADEIGELATMIITAAAETIKFVLAHKEAVLTVGLLVAGVGALSFTISSLTTIWRALNVVMLATTGSQIIPWLGSIFTTLKTVEIGALGLKGVIGSLAGVFLAWQVGWDVGTFLRKFDVVERAGISLSAGLTKGFLKIKEAWAWVSGGDADAVQREISEADRIYAEMFANVGKGAKEVAGIQKSAQKEVTAGAKDSADKQAQAQKGATDEMKKAYQDYADTVKKLQDDIAGREQDLAAQLREMGRSGMSDLDAWKDRKNQAEEYAAAARKAGEESKKAFEAGDAIGGQNKAEEAVELYDKARDAAADLNREVRDGDTVITSQQQNLQTAMSLVEEYGRDAIGVQQSLQEAIKQSAQALDAQSGGQLSKELPEVAKQFGDLKTQADDLAESAAEFDEAWNNAWDRATVGGQEAIAQLEKDLKELTKDRHIKVYVEEVEKKKSGGLIGYMRGGLIQALAAGGSVVRNVLAGAFLPGFGGGDRRLLLGEDGEVMLNKFSVKEAGLRAALAFNSGDWDVVISELLKLTGMDIRSMVGYHLGGLVGSMPSLQALSGGGAVETTGSSSTGKLIRHEHNLRSADGSRATVYTDDLNAGRLIGILRRAQVMSS